MTKADHIKSKHKFLLQLAFCQSVIVSFQVVAYWKKLELFSNAFGLWNILGYLICFPCTLSAYRNTDLLCGLLNIMLSFERRWTTFNYGNGSEIVGKCLIVMALGTFIPVVFSLGVFVLPCIPSYPGFWLLCKAKYMNQWKHKTFFLKLELLY